jgi:hypothetical protein
MLPQAVRSLLLNESQSVVLRQDDTLFSAIPSMLSHMASYSLSIPRLADETVASGTVPYLYELLTGSGCLVTAIAASDVEVR